MASTEDVSRSFLHQSSTSSHWVLKPKTINVPLDFAVKPLHSLHSILKQSKDRSKSKEIQGIPMDILVKIFRFFSERELTSRLAPVCRLWRNATKHPTLWKNLDFRGDNVSSHVICRMLRNCPQLQTLRLSAVPNVATIIRQVCRVNPDIKHVAMKNCFDDDEIIREAVFRNLITSCNQLRTLDLRGTQFKARRFYQDLVFLPFLKSLNISMNRYLKVQDLLAVALNCRSLEELVLSPRHLKLEDHDASFLITNLQRSITSLKFDVSGLNGATFQAVLGCSRLKCLSLTQAYLLPGDILRAIPKQLPHLTALRLSHATLLTTEDFCSLFDPQNENINKLFKLDFSGCWGLDDVGLRAIIDATADNLQYLGLKCCKKISTGAINYAIERCTKLQHLNVAHVNVGGDSFSIIPYHLPELKLLVVDTDGKRRKQLRGLKTKMKTLKIMESLSEYSRNESLFQI